MCWWPWLYYIDQDSAIDRNVVQFWWPLIKDILYIMHGGIVSILSPWSYNIVNLSRPWWYCEDHSDIMMTMVIMWRPLEQCEDHRDIVKTTEILWNWDRWFMKKKFLHICIQNVHSIRACFCWNEPDLPPMFLALHSLNSISVWPMVSCPDLNMLIISTTSSGLDIDGRAQTNGALVEYTEETGLQTNQNQAIKTGLQTYQNHAIKTGLQTNQNHAIKTGL